MIHKPLTEANFVDVHFDENSLIYKSEVQSAVELLKERVKRIGYKDAYKTTEQIINECFPIFAEKENCPCGVVTCEGSVCELNKD